MRLQNLPLHAAKPRREILGAWENADTQTFFQSLEADEPAPKSGFETLSAQALAAAFACYTHSPFLRDLLQRHHGFILETANTPPEAVVTEVLASLAQDYPSQIALRQGLRQARQKLMLYLALADCAQTVELETLTHALSQLADQALTAALRFELKKLADKGDMDADCARTAHCGMAILGLGKLGGNELNYSSDIDLMIFFEPDLFLYRGRKDKKEAAVSLARAVCGHISAKTSDGFVFRVDLRLRPNPSSTPIAMTLDAAEAYYQSIGQTWERAALIKARHSAGDPRVAEDFLSRVRPFTWRRHLDFAAIDDVHAMKMQVHAHHHHDAESGPGPGFDVKLGYGGIREIEFFAQIHQLIMGGKRPDLQVRATCDVLRGLAAEGDISEDDCTQLIDAYTALRKSEHAMQMIADAQTHSFPEDEASAQAVAGLMGYETTGSVYAMLALHCSHVQTQFNSILDQDTADAAETPGAFQGSQRYTETVKRWRSGTYRALRSERSIQLLNEVMADLMTAFAKTPDPEETLLGFDTFLSQLPAGVQLFSLLNANRALMSLLASIMGQSPELALQITRRPSLFDGLLSGDLQNINPAFSDLQEDLNTALSRARDYESVLDITRIWNGEARFRTGVQLLESLISPIQAMQTYSDIAEVSVATLYAHVAHNFSEKHGTVTGGSFAIIALGSFGARELGPNSDLDLTFLYDVPAGQMTSGGEKPLSVREYYARMSQRIISAITSMTSEGRLYEVDMRLRPSGRSGIIAVSQDAFLDYHQEKAWLWERMSLTKARSIGGAGALVKHFSALRDTVLKEAVSTEAALNAVWDMRGRLAEAAPGKPDRWALKGGEGGLTDADFLVEGLAIIHAKSMTPLEPMARWQAWWLALQKAGVVQEESANEVSLAHNTLLEARTCRNLLMSGGTNIAQAPSAARRKLAAMLGYEDLEKAQIKIDQARKVIWENLNALLPPP